MIADMIALRLAGKALFSQATLQGQLAQVEWAEEKNRLLKMFIVVLLGYACLLCVMLLIVVLVLMISWTTVYKIPALILMIFIYGAGLGFSLQRIRHLSAQGDQSFSASRAELAADIALLRNKL